MPQLNLLVIRCNDIEESRCFYEKLGFSFIKEQHKNSPIHYSSTVNELVFELYPLKKGEKLDNTRLGFKIKKLVNKTNTIDPD
ncbi:MAG: VOC family protein, partial [Sulfurovaceae bacterium]|nr:VOC family protein [Sulfurovaceae bacterium]